MTMTLDEAIQHYEEEAELAKKTPHIKGGLVEKCGQEHEQLAEWLKELKDYREGSRTCENCKHERKAETEYPCSICRCNHPNKFEWKGGAE